MCLTGFVQVTQYFSACFACFDHYMWGGHDSKGLNGNQFGCWDQKKQHFCNVQQDRISNLPTGRTAILHFSDNIQIYKMPKFKPFRDFGDALPSTAPSSAPTAPPSTFPTSLPSHNPTFSPSPVPTPLPAGDVLGMTKDCQVVANAVRDTKL